MNSFLPLDPTELTRDYQGGLAVVAMISRLDTTDEDFLPPDIRTRRDWIDAIYRNRNHLEIILGRYQWPQEFDLTVFTAAITKADAKLSAMALPRPEEPPFEGAS